MRHMRHTPVLSVAILFGVPATLLADNCSGLTDCYGTQVAAVAVIGAIAIGLAVVWAWPILLEMLAVEGGTGAAIGSQEMLLARDAFLRAAEELSAEVEQGLNIEKIAGDGARKGIDDIVRLTNTYGGEVSDWAKMVSRSAETSPGRYIQLHWYENETTGEIFEMKISPQQPKGLGEDAALRKLWNSLLRWFS